MVGLGICGGSPPGAAIQGSGYLFYHVFVVVHATRYGACDIVLECLAICKFNTILPKGGAVSSDFSRASHWGNGAGRSAKPNTQHCERFWMNVVVASM